MEAVTYYQHPARVFTTQVSLPSGTTNFEIAADPGVELPGQNCEFCRNVRVYHWHAQNIQAAGIVLFPIKSQHPGGPHLSLMICIPMTIRWLHLKEHDLYSDLSLLPSLVDRQLIPSSSSSSLFSASALNKPSSSSSSSATSSSRRFSLFVSLLPGGKKIRG